MPERTATRPIKLDSFVKTCAHTIWATVEKHGRVGVQPEFLAWLNSQLLKRGKDTINLETCCKCKVSYWTLGQPARRFKCDDCAG